MKSFHLTIARVGENLFDGHAVSIILPGKEGVFEVLAGHEALVSPLKSGEARVKTTDGQTQTFPVVEGSIAEVSGGQATVLL